MSFPLARSAAGLALLAALTAGCSTAVAAHSSVPKPTATAHSVKPSAKPSAKPSVPPTTQPPAPPTTQPPAPPTTQPPASAPAAATMAAPPPNPIPQDNGGDHDPDNNGGPSDGDGNI
jgi:hypothetical protein